MGIAEVASLLLRTEETFSARLARINSVVLKPLLQSGPFENKKLFLRLNENFQALWDLTEESCRTLKRHLGTPEFASSWDIYLLSKADLFLDTYIQYFSAFASCVAIHVFEHAARNKREVWKLHKTALQQLLHDFSPDTSIAIALHTVLQKPIRDQLHQYNLVLSRLKEATDQFSEREEIAAATEKFANLRSFVGQALDEACLTGKLWKSLCHKLTDELCVPERRLLEDSQNVAVSASTGRSDRVLLFNDILVLIQGSSYQSFDLKLVWVDGISSEAGRHTLHIDTPEEEFFLLARDPQAWAVWQWKLKRAVCQAMDGRRDFPLWGRAGEGREPPLCRCSTFTFRGEGRLKDAVYEGEWRLGKPHGKGTLMWPDGRNYVGDFEEGLEHGFGICLVPCASEDRYDCYKCHWRGGRRSGYGICEYGNEVVYKGYFKDNLRHGFGILDSSSSKEHPSRYTGHWENDKRSGYGVWDDKERGERYIGMWHEDQRHGAGIVVMQSGVCYQRTFHMDKMVRSGILLLEDDSVYEGNFTRDLTFVGKGKLTANKFTLEGTFSHRSSHGTLAQGILNTSGEPLGGTVTKLQLGQVAFPVQHRWEGIFGPFMEFVHSGARGETEEFFMGFHVQTSRELRKSQEYLFCHRGPEEAVRKVDLLEELREHRQQEALRCYLEQALKSSLHPLGKLLTALTVAFQATYSGIGANKHLLSMAQEEVKHYAEKIWEFYQCLLNLAWEVKGQAPPEALKDSDLWGPGLILPLILPCFYPELLMLYMLHHEKEDELYCQGIVNLSLFPDVKLLEFLDVQRHFWPLKDVTLSNSRRRSLVKNRCFRSATECLQKLITTVDPREKLGILQQTFEEVERTVRRALGKEHSLSMDELLPLLVYVVIRASIQHLGAEIHLIRDLMDPANKGGLHDFLLTTLESCYEFIQKETRLHPSWRMSHDA